MKILTKGLAALAAGLLIVLATAIPSFATHPAVVLTGFCNPVTGKVDLSGTVTGDPAYNNVKGKVVSESIAFAPSFVGLDVKGSKGGSSTATGLAYATSYKLKIGVQFENHSAGDIVYNEATYTPNFRSCAPTDKLDATASVVVTPATCESAGVPSFAIENATWENETDVTDGERKAIANTGHRFADNSTTALVTYTIEPKLSQNEPPCKTNKPDDLVEVVVTYSDPDCVTLTVTKTTTTTTTGSEYDPITNTWPRTAPVVVSVPELIELTSDQLRDCTPKPEDESSFVEFRDTDCDRDDVTIRRIITKVTSEWNGSIWERVIDVTIESYTDEKNADEIAECIPPTEPPVECDEGEEVSNGACVPADEPNPGKPDAPSSLAVTGANPAPGIFGAALLTLAGGFMLWPSIARRIRAKKLANN